MFEIVKVELSKYYRETQGGELKQLDIISNSERPYSSVYFLKTITTKGTEKLVLKKIDTQNEMNFKLNKKENQSVVEYNILSKLHPIFSKVDGCHVPRPIIRIPDLHIIITEFVEGDILTDRLGYLKYFANGKEFENLQKVFFLIGRWLKKFHETTGVKNADISIFENTIERCEKHLDIIEENGGQIISKNFKEVLMGSFLKNIMALKGKEINVSGRHGDFGHWNVMINNNGVTVIDFLGYGYEPRCADLMKMLTFFRTIKYNVFNNPFKINRLKENFLRGYGQIMPIQKEVVELYENQQRIHNLCGSILNRGYNRFDVLIRKRMIKDDVDWLLNEKHRNYIWPREYIIN